MDDIRLLSEMKGVPTEWLKVVFRWNLCSNDLVVVSFNPTRKLLRCN